MKVYNSATRTKEEFVPLEGDNVRMYACGITVYDDCHIGHARQAIAYDMISKYLRFKGYKVTYVRNYTDVDDKIIARANQLGVNAVAYAEQKIRESEEDLKRLNVKDADRKPKVSECIPDIIAFIEGLIEKKHAYVSKKGDVWYSVMSFPGYGKLSRKDPDQLLEGVRKDLEEGKKDPRDFALWKSAKKDEIFWKSPWGNGRPGWHIECSAMALKNLGETLDIHGGGKDLIFPHHENEIAQSEALTGKPLARYWTHNGLVTIDGQKMSKSLGNTLTIKEALRKYHPEVIRHAMLSRHYSADVDISAKEFALSEKSLYYFYKTLGDIDAFLAANSPTSEKLTVCDDISANVKSGFVEAMDDDFNSSLAISHLFQICKFVNTLLADKKQPKGAVVVAFQRIRDDIGNAYAVLGLMQEPPGMFIRALNLKHLEEAGLTEEKVQALIEERATAKQKKDYAAADEIREKLDQLGITLQDSRTGTTWGLKLGALPEG
ncbi:MAG: cysteine--tRNA ligase [Alphaproteobacteria bacterium]|nr:cysteine--tRNA ligase [Alphaproteobacteria bacterium]